MRKGKGCISRTPLKNENLGYIAYAAHKCPLVAFQEQIAGDYGLSE